MIAVLVGGPEEGKELALRTPGVPIRVARAAESNWYKNTDGTSWKPVQYEYGEYHDAGPDDPEEPDRRIYEWQGWGK